MFHSACAQSPGAAARIGYLDANSTPGWFEAFQRGLQELGYVENRNIVIEKRSAEGRAERLPALAAELVRLSPRVIVVSTPPAALAARTATATIPIVVANATDLEGLGLVQSLAHPGGNVTGLSNLQTGVMGKRLELLAELVPGISHIRVVWEPGVQGPEFAFRELKAAAATSRFTLEPFEVKRPEDIGPAFAAFGAPVGAGIVLNGPITVRYRAAVAAAAAQGKLPSIFYDIEFVRAGGLLSYGPNIPELHRRAAVYVDKILKGAKPSDLPVEQANVFDLVVNLRAAKALGIAIPQSILVRADEVIE